MPADNIEINGELGSFGKQLLTTPFGEYITLKDELNQAVYELEQKIAASPESSPDDKSEIFNTNLSAFNDIADGTKNIQQMQDVVDWVKAIHKTLRELLTSSGGSQPDEPPEPQDPEQPDVVNGGEIGSFG